MPRGIDVFIDSNRVYSDLVDGGSFLLQDTPIHGGSADAPVVVRSEDGEVISR